jgi:hypothetical protein
VDTAKVIADDIRDIGLEIKPMIGDSVYAITDEVAGTFIERLQGMDDLGAADLACLQTKYVVFA